MDKNASIVQSVQSKIDLIVEEVPKLFQSLDVVMAPTVLAALLCDQDPVLRMLWPLRYNLPGPFSAPVLGNVVSDRAVSDKQEELTQLTAEVVLFFKRVRIVLPWNVVFDLCSANHRIVILPVGPHEPLKILEVYCCHVDGLHEQELRQEMLRELDSSPSSNDNYSR